MKILFTTDLHGNRRCYDRLSEVARVAEVDVVINGGDMLPNDSGLFGQGDFITGFLADHFAAMAEPGIRYLCYLGNDDLRVFDDVFGQTCAKYPHVTNLAQRLVEIDGYEFVGMNWVVDYPFRLKDRCRMDTRDYVFQQQYGSGLLSTPSGWKEIPDWPAYAATLPTFEDELQSLPRPRNTGKAIYVIHVPPAGLGLDMCRDGRCVGSQALTAFIENARPLYSLHGHIHESPQVSGKWHACIGRTTCIQPGQGPAFTYVILDSATGTFHRHTALP